MGQDQLKILELAIRILYQGKHDQDWSWIEHEAFKQLLEVGGSQSASEAAIGVIRAAIARTGWFENGGIAPPTQSPPAQP